MNRILHSLRNKPDHIKTRYVIVLSVIATVVVVGVWVVTLRLIKTSDDTIKAESPFKIFGQLFGKTAVETKQNYNDQKQSLDTDMETALSQDTDNTVPVVLPDTSETPIAEMDTAQQ